MQYNLSLPDMDSPTHKPNGSHRLGRLQFSLKALMMLIVGAAAILMVLRAGGVLALFALLLYCIPLAVLRWWLKGDGYLFTLKVLTIYGLVSMLTVLFSQLTWLGMVAFNVVQLPKWALADWLRTDVVMKAAIELGWSRPSPIDGSPVWPYSVAVAMVISYLVPLAIALGVIGWRTRLAQPYRVWTVALLIVAALDFCLTSLPFIVWNSAF